MAKLMLISIIPYTFLADTECYLNIEKKKHRQVGYYVEIAYLNKNINVIIKMYLI